MWTSSVFSQQDIWKPDTPFLDSVSVDYSNLNGNVIIGWEPSDSLDVMGYFIYRNFGDMSSTNFVTIDSVFGRTTTSYIDYSANAEFHSEGYRISAFDSSRNLSALSATHYTVYTSQTPETIDCQFHIKLNWNTYTGWADGITQYNIYRDKNHSGNLTYIGTVSGSQTYFIDKNITDNTSYCYYIRAIGHNGFSSSSNQICRVVNIPDNPQFITSLNASVESENQISLKFLVDTGAENISEYRVLRSNSLTGTYKTIKTIPFSKNSEINIIDNVPSDTKKYYYKIDAYNSCGKQIIESGIVSNIVISAINNGDLRHTLYWEDFYQWLGGIQNFELHRINDETDEVILSSIHSIDSYMDDISELPFNSHYYSGKFCYYIRYFEGSNNPYGYQDSSRSNMICTQESSRVFLPNAFAPLHDGSVNNTFKPSALFISKNNYRFTIFNRWGEKIFETYDPEKGWDGKYKSGKVAPSGIYIYTLMYQDANDNIQKLSGIFTSVQ